MPTLLLIDGHSQAYRAYFGMKTPLTTRSGEPTGAVYGFARKLLSVLKEYRPEYVATAFDAGDTWRHAEFPAYKGTRESMPDDMRPQMERIAQLVRAFNIPLLTYENFEADDILGALGREAGEQGFDVLIMSGDRDMFQLVTERVKILYTSGGPNPATTVYGPTEVQERYGLTPRQFIDYKALTGDSSDNIPGVPGVGDKTATKLLQQFDSIDGIYANLAAVSGEKLKKNLQEHRLQVEQNLRLVTIVTQLDDLHFDAEACKLRDYDPERVTTLFLELEFRTLARELPEADLGVGQAPAVTAPPTTGDGQMALFAANESTQAPVTAESIDDPARPPAARYQIVQAPEQLDVALSALAAAALISFDVETTGTDAMQAALVGLGLTWTPGEAIYIPVAHDEATLGGGTQLPWETVRSRLQPLLDRPGLAMLAHSGKYDLTVLRRHGLELPGVIEDTMLMAWLLDPGNRAIGLKALASAELGWQMTELTELIGTGRKQITVAQVPVAQAGAYCGADVDATIRLYERLEPRLEAAGIKRLYSEIERPLIHVLTDMEMAGVLLDSAFLKEMSVTFTARLAALEDELFQLVGHPFNLRSTQQLSQVLFDQMGFPTKGLARTASGHYSTAVETLDLLAANEALSVEQQQVITRIQEQRQLEKLRGTYIDALPALVNPVTGRVHTSFSQTGAVTGRMSSSNPNLQNIPIRTEIGREIRRAFIAPPGWTLISADYSQVELRVLAHVAQEQPLIDAFLADHDIHSTTASKLFHIPLAEVTKAQRGLGKTINFATIYGVSAFGLSSRTELKQDEAKEFLRQYFEAYPNVRRYLEQTKAMAATEGYVETLLGRRRYFPELRSRSLTVNMRLGAERMAINAPIQGTAADIMKIAMIRLHAELKAQGFRTRMLLQVHDELVLEAPDEEVVVVSEVVRRCMEDAYQLVVPLKVDVEAGPNWRDLEPV